MGRTDEKKLIAFPPLRQRKGAKTGHGESTLQGGSITWKQGDGNERRDSNESGGGDAG